MDTVLEMAKALRSPVVALAAVSFTLLATLAEKGGLAGLWLAVLVFAAIAKYPYAVTRSAAAGEREPAPASLDDFNPTVAPEYLVHAGILVAAKWVITTNAGAPTVLAAAALATVLPASVAIMATTGRLTAALNPLAIVALVRALGRDYALLLAFAAGLILATAAVDLLMQMPVLTRFASMYALIGVFAATGRLLHLRRFELDLAVTSAADRRAASDRALDTRQWENALDEIYGLLSTGDAARGYTRIDALLAAEDHSVASYEMLYERMRGWGMQRHTSRVAADFVRALAEQGAELQRALEVTEERLRHDERFRPDTPHAAAIVAHARSVGHEATAAAIEEDARAG